MKRVLLVDADPVTRDRLSGSLSPPEYELIYARTAALAIEVSRRERMNAAICECLLPDLSGIHLLSRLHKQLPTMPIIMIAPYDLEWIRASVLEAGAARYVTKPLDPADLIRSLELLWNRNIQEPSPRLSENEIKLMDRAREFIHEHYSERVTLARVADQLGMSRFSLCRKFKAAHGCCFRDHLLHVRISRARLLLAQRRHTITEIAYIVGFGDLPRFDKNFKRATGSAPSSCRKPAAAAG